MAMVPDRDGVDIRMSLTHVIRTSIPHAHTHRHRHRQTRAPNCTDKSLFIGLVFSRELGAQVGADAFFQQLPADDGNLRALQFVVLQKVAFGT